MGEGQRPEDHHEVVVVASGRHVPDRPGLRAEREVPAASHHADLRDPVEEVFRLFDQVTSPAELWAVRVESRSPGSCMGYR